MTRDATLPPSLSTLGAYCALCSPRIIKARLWTPVQQFRLSHPREREREFITSSASRTGRDKRREISLFLFLSKNTHSDFHIYKGEREEERKEIAALCALKCPYTLPGENGRQQLIYRIHNNMYKVGIYIDAHSAGARADRRCLT